MKTVKLLLTTTVDNLGIVGDVVNVSPGYARNFLLPRNMATDPTPGNVARLAEERKRVESDLKKHRADLEAVLKRLEGHEVTVQRSANDQGILYGGVSQHDIAVLLREEGFPVEDRAVRIGDQIKRLDTYDIPIVLASDLKTEIKLWVVSDKPADQLAAQEDVAEEDEAEKEETAEEDEEAAVATKTKTKSKANTKEKAKEKAEK